MLGLHKGATEDQIKQAYVSLVKKYDPEIHTDRFMIVQNAFDRLKDPERRAIEDIMTFNHLQSEYMFTKEERAEVPDAKLGQAIGALEAKKSADPSSAKADEPRLIQGYMIRSCKNIRRKLLKEAVDDWMRVTEIDPTNQRAKNNLLAAFIRLGYSYANHKLYEEAVEVWEKATRMDPDNEQIIHNIALASEFGDNVDDARRYWDEIIRRWRAEVDRGPASDYLKNRLVAALRHQAEWASEMDETAADNSAPSPPAASPSAPPRPGVQPQAQPQAQKGKPEAPKRARQRAPATPEQELEQCREIIKLKPEDFDANFRLGQLLMDQKVWAEAAKHLAGLHRKFPRNVEVINLLGWAQLNSQQPDPAFQTWQRGLKLDPKNFNIREALIKAHMLMGRALRDKSLFIKALVHFKRLATYLPDSDEVHFELGRTYQLKGDARSAYTEFQKAVQINPKHKQARGALSELKLSRA